MKDLKFDDQGLIPAIVQDERSNVVLMLGYMNAEAIHKTLESKKVTFYSRSRKCLWTKGESSGNYLDYIHMKADCDKDSLLIKAVAHGPTCHTGTDTCWKEENQIDSKDFLHYLESVIENRKLNPSNNSYTSSLFLEGINKIAQKVGEEAVELVIESKDQNNELFKGEAADLLFHFLVLLQAKDISLQSVLEVLEKRHK